MSRSSIFNSDQRRALAFVRRVLLVLSPLLLGAALFETAMYRTGETWPVSRVVARQAGLEDFLYSRIYFSQQFNLYKYAVIRQERPRILVLGSSRVMQLRDFMFHPMEAAFYNAGGMIQNISDLSVYAGLVRRKKLPRPDVVIVGLDPWWFNTRMTTAESWLEGDRFRDEAYLFSAHVDVARRLIRRRTFPWYAVRVGALAPSPYYGVPAIGAHALTAGAGFRPDGSRQYSPRLILQFLKTRRYVDRKTPSIIERIEGNIGLFGLPVAIDPAMVERLTEALRSLASEGVEVHAFLPPLADGATRAILDSPTLRGWWLEFTTEVPAALERAGIPCAGATRPADYGLDDTYMFDGMHPSEVYVAYIVKDMLASLADGSTLSGVDAAYIGGLLDRADVIPLAFTLPPVSLDSPGAP